MKNCRHPTHWLLSTQRDALEDGERAAKNICSPSLSGAWLFSRGAPRRDVDPQSANGQRDLCAYNSCAPRHAIELAARRSSMLKAQ